MSNNLNTYSVEEYIDLVVSQWRAKHPSKYSEAEIGFLKGVAIQKLSTEMSLYEQMSKAGFRV